MDPLGNPLTTRPIQTCWEIGIEPYPNWLFGCVDNPDRQFGNGLVLSRTRSRSDGPEPLLKLFGTLCPLMGMGVWLRPGVYAAAPMIGRTSLEEVYTGNDQDNKKDVGKNAGGLWLRLCCVGFNFGASGFVRFRGSLEFWFVRKRL